MFRNKKILTDEELNTLINNSSNETISRNVWTSITTISAVIVLLCVGLNDIYTFNVSILIGLVAGGISSLLIGPRVWMALEKKSK